MVSGWFIALGLLVAYVLVLFWLLQSGRMQKWNLSLMLGFALMVRTHRGKGLIETIARPKRFWNAFGDVATVVTLVGMALMAVVMLLTAWITIQPDSPVQPLAANEILVIPGVNPFVPLWYGLIALIVTLVVHEGGHGILARANGLRVKSLGLLVAVVPIGAFVEPDEDDLKAASRRRRLRVFAAGPGINLAFAALCLVALASLAGALVPREGVHVALTVQGAPSDDAGLEAGDILLAADTTPLPDWDAFQDFMQTRSPGDTVTFQVRHPNGSEQALTATLQSRWDQLTDAQRDQLVREDPARAEEFQDDAYFGVAPLLPSMTAFLAHPVSSLTHFGQLVSLPVGEVRGQPLLSTYLPAFYETPFATQAFWIAFNLAFWVFWLNLMVGLTNILPLGILDGGHIFRDAVSGLVERLRPAMPAARRDRLVTGASRTVSWVIGIAFLLQIFGPRIVQAFA